MINNSLLEQPSISSRVGEPKRLPLNRPNLRVAPLLGPLMTPGNAYKRYQISKDFEEIEKWLDSKEISYEQQKYDIVGRTDLLSEEQDGFFFEQYSIFYSSMKETLGLIGKSQSDLTNLLNRMLAGFHQSFHHFRERLRLVRKNGDDQIATLRERLDKVTRDYDEYHSKHDLDRYFRDHLSKETRAQVI